MVVLDSSFLIAFHNSRDVHHSAAARAMDELITPRRHDSSSLVATFDRDFRGIKGITTIPV